MNFPAAREIGLSEGRGSSDLYIYTVTLLIMHERARDVGNRILEYAKRRPMLRESKPCFNPSVENFTSVRRAGTQSVAKFSVAYARAVIASSNFHDTRREGVEGGPKVQEREYDFPKWLFNFIERDEESALSKIVRRVSGNVRLVNIHVPFSFSVEEATKIRWYALIFDPPNFAQVT